jgi:hypothetical protein
MKRAPLVSRLLLGALGAVLWTGGVLSLTAQPAAGTGTPLVGTFLISAGSCSGGTASGTYLRMVLSGGTNAAGPYFSNSDSTCSDNTYTPLAPGSDGGLITGSYQPQPSPAFDSSGNALASEITAPVAFEGVKFSTATSPVDPQTGLHVPAPSIVATGTALSGNLQSFGVSWNNQEFNQGSPKPDGSSPGNTTPVTGVYNPTTGAYTLQWSSQVVGGPFNGFSAFWNLTGRFVAAGGSTSSAGSSATASTPTTAGTSTAPHTSATHVGSSSPASTGSASGASAAAGAVASGQATTTTTSPTTGTSAAKPTSAHTVVSVSTVTASRGWKAPTWLDVLAAVLAVAGLAGVIWSERQLRRRRGDDDLELKGA